MHVAELRLGYVSALFFNLIFFNMKQNFFVRPMLCASLMLMCATGCEKQIETQNPAENQLVNNVQNKAQGENELLLSRSAQQTNEALLQTLKGATSRFNSTTQATNAGYVADANCVSVPGLGGMGYHWPNRSLFDAVFDMLKPEVLLYETGPGGNMRLVAVEYIVLNTGQARPMFGDHLFDIRGTPVPVPHWSLHVWIHKENPNGVFTRFNPTVSCP